MRVVSGSSSETTIDVLAGQDKLDGLVAKQAFWMTEEVQSRQAPIHTVEPQVLGQPVVQFVTSL